MKDMSAISHSHLVSGSHFIEADRALKKNFFVFHSVHRPLESTDVYFAVGSIEIRMKNDCSTHLRKIFVDLLVSETIWVDYHRRRHIQDYRVAVNHPFSQLVQKKGN